ncbi:MAG TPA: MIP/aquaporin family protein [Methanomassiliicoccales archaeon]|nr:MIP/aquaporin family protein [Methanomassiliicoccales archaeon]
MKQNLTAEFLGSMFLVIVAIGSTILPIEVFHVDIGIAVFMNAMAVAMVLFALIETFAPISGAHFNPAVTLSLMISKDIAPRKAALYILVQMVGAFVGLLVTHLMFWDVNQTLITISENGKTPSLYFAEFIGTFALMAVIYGCVRSGSKSTPLAVAYVVGGMLITTSSTMYANPAVTFARMFTYAICGITPGDAIIFIIAEIIGAIVAAYVIGKVLYPKKLDTVCSPFNCPPKLIDIK